MFPENVQNPFPWTRDTYISHLDKLFSMFLQHLRAILQFVFDNFMDNFCLCSLYRASYVSRERTPALQPCRRHVYVVEDSLVQSAGSPLTNGTF